MSLGQTASAVAPGYCPSTGGDTSYEYISGATLDVNPDGTMRLTVQVFIANPTGCTPGQPCPEYDDSPEYVNAWIDWNGDKKWEAWERVMDDALTGYLNINYFGTMTAVAQFSPPSSITPTDQPTWLRANLGWAYDPNNPCEQTWTWGNVVDQEVELTLPEIQDITVQGIGTTNDQPETGSEVQLEASVDVPTGYEITNCSWTGNLPPGSGDTANDCRYRYTPATGDGPDVDTYGEKDVTLTVTYRRTPGGATGQTSKDHTYNVFFEKTGDDDGDCRWWVFWADCEPNWFEYWGDDGAVPGLTATDVVYDGDTTAIGVFRSSTDNIHMGDAAALFDGPLSVPSSSTCPGGSFPGARGIDLAAITLSHERRHKVIHHNWDPGGIWENWPDSDEGIPNASYDDDLPDDYEISVTHTATDTVDSCNLAGLFAGSNYHLYGDNEFAARQAELGVSGNADNDWANPGKQTVPSYGVLTANSLNLAAFTGGGSGKSDASSPHAISAGDSPQMGNLTGAYSDTANDTDGDGTYDNLQLSVGVHLTETAKYNVVAWLESGSGSGISWANATGLADPGTYTLDLLFDGLAFSTNNVDGPYSVSRVELRVGYEDHLADAAEDVYTTAGYLSTDFDPLNVAFGDSHSELGIDAGTDGLYDKLRINVAVDVREAGTYTFIGELEGSDNIAVTSTTAFLAAGTHAVALDFDGRLIFQHRQSGPYELTSLRAHDMDGNDLDFIQDAYTTAAYSYSQFQHEGTTIDATGHSDMGVDIDGDGDYDYLRLFVTINAAAPGSFKLLANLTDSESAPITNVDEDIDLVAGPNVLALDFPGGRIHRHGVNGPYQITSLSLLDDQGFVVDAIQSAHMTQAYDYTDFSAPLVTLSGGLTDYGLDTNGNGKYDFLNIDVEVIPGDAGVIVAQAQLVDNAGLEIKWAENDELMSAGIAQSITLSFPAQSIITSGEDGPYELRNLIVFHTGDPEQDVFLPVAHTTASYKVGDFDSKAYLPVGLKP